MSWSFSQKSCYLCIPLTRPSCSSWLWARSSQPARDWPHSVPALSAIWNCFLRSWRALQMLTTSEGFFLVWCCALERSRSVDFSLFFTYNRCMSPANLLNPQSYLISQSLFFSFLWFYFHSAFTSSSGDLDENGACTRLKCLKFLLIIMHEAQVEGVH